MVRMLTIERLEARELKSVNSVSYKIANGKDIQLNREDGIEATEETSLLDSIHSHHSVGDRNGDGLDDVFLVDGDGQMWLGVGQRQPTKSSYIRSNGIRVFAENEPYLQELPYHYSSIWPESPLYEEVRALEDYEDEFFDFNGDGVEDAIDVFHSPNNSFVEVVFGLPPFVGWVDPKAGLILQNTEGVIDVLGIEIQGQNLSLREESPFNAVLADSNTGTTISLEGAHAANGNSFAVGVDAGCNFDREIDVIVRDRADNVYELKVPVYDRTHGDLNASGTVDFQDFLVMSANFGSDCVGYNDGDIDGNGVVDFHDFLTLARSYGESVGC